MTRRAKIVVGILVLLMTVVILLFFSLNSWLQSESGRHLLQRELSKGLGANVTISGTYSLSLIPALHVTGRSMEVTQVQGEATIASVARYSRQTRAIP